MSDEQLEITPSTTVHRLLEAYPELEDVLIGMAPPFKKLKNPMLRRSVAKVATIKHISVVGQIPINDLVDTLRESVGQDPIGQSFDDEEYFFDEPDWFAPDKVTLALDEDKVEEKDKMTLVVILQEATHVDPGEIIELTTTFIPAPGIDIMRDKGYLVWSRRLENSNQILTYFLKPGEP
jgi:hypothetical protein